MPDARLLAAAGALLLGMVWLQVQGTLLGYKASATREELDRLRARNAYLRLEIERLQSPVHLESEAKRRLGMRRPDPDQMVVLVGPPGPAAGAAAQAPGSAALPPQAPGAPRRAQEPRALRAAGSAARAAGWLAKLKPRD